MVGLVALSGLNDGYQDTNSAVSILFAQILKKSPSD
jgi:hypothetical protein